MSNFLLLAGLLSIGCRAAPLSPPAGFAALGLPAALSKTRLQSLLQEFVDRGYERSFRRLGDENDFDHGHVLIDARTRTPFAILYHTQELAHEGAGYVDADGRNWIQWLDGRGVENARLYERAAYPRSASWDWFVARELPKLRGRRTITDRMLDPARLGAELAPSIQWTFTRVACAAGADEPASAVMRVALPDRTPVCLELGSSSARAVPASASRGF
jgi:hypothetical protein